MEVNLEVDQIDTKTDTPEEKRFKMCYVDADTILHSAAIALQQRYINVKHIPSGRIQRFDNKTEFGIRNGNIIPNKWLDKKNKEFEEKGKKGFSVDDFEIEELWELKPEFSDIEAAMEHGLESIAFSVGGIKKFSNSEDYRLIISAGHGNYRNDLAKTLKYKGNRGDKPILYAELKEAMINQYRNHIILAEHCEAEDVCGWKAKEEENRVGEDFDKWEICIAYVDKDVNCVYAPSINYQHFEDGFTYPTKLDCARSLVAQIICGDTACDNIQGLTNLPVEVTDKFGLRKAVGCGKTTAYNLLETCSTEKEMYERAVFAYQSVYGLDPVKFKAWDGEELEWTWLDFMQETAVLVKMQDFEGEIFNVKDKLDSLYIDYTRKLFEEPKLLFTNKANAEELVKRIRTKLQSIAGDIKSYSPLKKAALVDMLKSTREQLDEVLTQFDEFYELEELPSTGRRSLLEWIDSQIEGEPDAESRYEVFTEAFKEQEIIHIDKHRWYNIISLIGVIEIDNEPRYFSTWKYDISGDNSLSDMDLELPDVTADICEVFPTKKEVTVYE